ncbi:phosphatidylinositol mannoside acyltransferase [Pseudokineococcus sp. 1T1Z-3]|uniref:phosphatidylinositol mannoside acyltransferase n=1 Tax=Pseudokineococcus sp. 1T1Z-3 TaxID=3132745 RepID=UPI0030A7B78B
MSAHPLLLTWRAVGALPETLAHRAAAGLADVVWVASGTPGIRRAPALGGVRALAANLDAARPGLGRRASRRLLRAALRSYARYWVELFRLGSWSEERRRAAYRPVAFEELRAELATGRGAVVALSHSASWDVAGAYAALDLAPTTTVAERVEPAAVYDAFVAARAAVGVEALPLTGGAPPLPQLVRRLRAGHLVPLLVDRDLGGAAVEVDLLGGRARVASGAAALADLAGCGLFVLESWYERDAAAPGGWVVAGRAHRVERATSGPRGERVTATTQALADLLGAAISRHPQDWHVLSPVLLPPRARQASAGAGPRPVAA